MQRDKKARTKMGLKVQRSRRKGHKGERMMNYSCKREKTAGKKVVVRLKAARKCDVGMRKESWWWHAGKKFCRAAAAY